MSLEIKALHKQAFREIFNLVAMKVKIINFLIIV